MKKLPKIDLKSLHMPSGMQGVITAMGQGSKKVSYIGAVAGAGIDIVSATRDERGYLSGIADEYRPEIAERLGLAEEQVTQEHYQLAFKENPVLAQVQHATKMSGTIRGINSAIAAAVGVLAGLGASILTRQAQSGGKQADAANIAGGVASTFGAAAAGKVARKLLHTKNLDKSLESTAHYKIMGIKAKQQHGEETTAADIFEVQLALNPQVGDVILQGTGQRFSDMQPDAQKELLRSEFPEIFEVNSRMAKLINEEGLRPQKLVFGEIRELEKEPETPMEPMAPGHPDLPPNAAAAPQKEAIEASGADEAGKALLAALNNGEEVLQQNNSAEQAAQPVTPRSETPMEMKETPVQAHAGEGHGQEAEAMAKEFERRLQAMQENGQGETRGEGHAERFASKEQGLESFASRIDAERARQQEAAPQR